MLLVARVCNFAPESQSRFSEIFIIFFFLCNFSPQKRYTSWDGYGREMSESGSLFRHGTLRWTYAPRSKRALCLPQCIPNRSDKVPPLCDPDPLLIMDRLQNRPLRSLNWSCTQGCGLRSEDSCGMLMNTHDMTCQLSCSVTASNRLGAMWSFSFSSASPFKNVPVRSPRVWIWSYHVLYLHESS